MQELGERRLESREERQFVSAAAILPHSLIHASRSRDGVP